MNDVYFRVRATTPSLSIARNLISVIQSGHGFILVFRSVSIGCLLSFPHRIPHTPCISTSLTNESTIREVEMLKEQLRRAKPSAVSLIYPFVDREAHTFSPLQPLIIVANKLDLASDRRVSAQAVRDLAEQWNVPVYETSAKKNWQIAAVFEELVRLMRLQYPAEPKRRRKLRDKICLVM
jgi:GTPase SAR1 family protein